MGFFLNQHRNKKRHKLWKKHSTKMLSEWLIDSNITAKGNNTKPKIIEKIIIIYQRIYLSVTCHSFDMFSFIYRYCCMFGFQFSRCLYHYNLKKIFNIHHFVYCSHVCPYINVRVNDIFIEMNHPFHAIQLYRISLYLQKQFKLFLFSALFKYRYFDENIGKSAGNKEYKI